MKPIVWGALYVLKYQLARHPAPLICGLVLTNRCNLRCQHCRIPDRKDEHLSFDEVKRAIDAYYTQGGRCLYLQGGEPLLWRDSDRGIEDVVSYAHKTGFFTVIIYTNGTFPLDTSADTVFVSVDGLQQVHDRHRGTSFSKIMKNIDSSPHPALFINFTINRRNKDQLEEYLEYVAAIKNIRGTFFYFHTPYYGHDELYIEPDERQVILKRLIEFKRQYRILNSRAGLKSALRNDWRRPLKICSVFERESTYQCCRYPDDPELCRNCGYLSYAEIDQTLKLKPSAVFNALQYF